MLKVLKHVVSFRGSYKDRGSIPLISTFCMKKNPDNINLNFVKIEKNQKLNLKNRNSVFKQIRFLKEKQKKNWNFNIHNQILKLQKQINI